MLLCWSLEPPSLCCIDLLVLPTLVEADAQAEHRKSAGRWAASRWAAAQIQPSWQDTRWFLPRDGLCRIVPFAFPSLIPGWFLITFLRDNSYTIQFTHIFIELYHLQNHLLTIFTVPWRSLYPRAVILAYSGRPCTWSHIQYVTCVAGSFSVSMYVQ